MIPHKKPSLAVKAFNIAAALFILTLALGVVDGIYSLQRRQRQLRYYLPDTLRARAACWASRNIYELNGRIIRSLEELAQSAYYPFKEPYTSCCHGGSLVLTTSETSSSVTWVGHRVHRRVPTKVTTVSAEKASPDVRTKRILLSCMAGVHQRVSDIQAIRNTFVKMHEQAWKAGECPLEFTLKPLLHPPLERDLPSNHTELQVYLRWLCDTEGVRELTDAWGSCLVFALRGSYLVGRSRGPDGVLGTKDDVVVRVAVR